MLLWAIFSIVVMDVKLAATVFTRRDLYNFITGEALKTWDKMCDSNTAELNSK
ncbi:hypothetical protein KC19_2G079300 [Ceratodon purpureus]|uniref:Uncharacterized protein n=1 Tax=Ceratodon purpureus TaxID=3225 RepID=A0A8T0IUE1_CERPU|nr:hypothetical protein KC19_2G079300 [Ceratodon purpureus]